MPSSLHGFEFIETKFTTSDVHFITSGDIKIVKSKQVAEINGVYHLKFLEILKNLDLTIYPTNSESHSQRE